MKQVGLKYGVICGLVYIIVGLIGILAGINSGGSSLAYVLLAVMIGATFYVIYLGCKEYRDEVNGGALTIGDGVKLGLFIAFIAGIMGALFNLLYNNVIDPEMMETQMEAARDQLEERGMDDASIDTAMKISKIMQSPAVTILWTSLWGLVKGLIAAAILKKDAPPAA